jgi:hypothetical protein
MSPRLSAHEGGLQFRRTNAKAGFGEGGSFLVLHVPAGVRETASADLSQTDCNYQ